MASVSLSKMKVPQHHSK